MKGMQFLPSFGLGLTLASCLALALGTANCAAVYPELATRVQDTMPSGPLVPPPPPELRWVAFKSASVPPKTRDGRDWDSVLGSKPDPYAVLLVNKQELLRTPSQTDTLEPTWPDSKRGNFRLPPGAKVRVELWDSNQIGDQPIGIREVGTLTPEMLRSGELRVSFDGGGSVVLALEPAHAVYGAGLWYELRTDTCFITRTLDNSPAQRAELGKGDEVVKIAGLDVRQMEPDAIRSAFNAIPSKGLELSIRRKDGGAMEVSLQEGPIYALHSEYGDLP